MFVSSMTCSRFFYALMFVLSATCSGFVYTLMFVLSMICSGFFYTLIFVLSMTCSSFFYTFKFVLSTTCSSLFVKSYNFVFDEKINMEDVLRDLSPKQILNTILSLYTGDPSITDLCICCQTQQL